MPCGIGELAQDERLTRIRGSEMDQAQARPLNRCM
jgi:hypothetical protein